MSILLGPNNNAKSEFPKLPDVQVPGPSASESDHLSFEPGIRNVIVIQFRGTVEKHSHILCDMQLLDEAGLEDPRNWIVTVD